MSENDETSAVRRALDQARGQRTQITRGAPLPIDTVHVAGACPNCGQLGFTILGFPDPPYAGPRGQPRYRNAGELARFLDELVKNPPALPSPEDPADTKTNPPTWLGRCKCGAKIAPPAPDPKTGKLVGDPEATPRRVQGLRFLKAMPGSGAELMVEGLVRDGTTTYRVLRAPVDGGIETEVSDALDDVTIEKAFGRPLTLAQPWKGALDRAEKGEEVLEQVEPGYWIWAGPKENTDLEKRVQDTVAGNPERGAFPLLALPQLAPMPAGPAWPEWAYEHAEKIGKGDLRAGVILDRTVVRKLIENQLERVGFQWEERNDGALVNAVRGELRWPMEVAIVTLGAGHLGWSLAETAAAAVGEAMARIGELARFLDAARKERPDITFDVNGLQLLPKRGDGSVGRPMNLVDVPFRAPAGSKDFKRELKFACDDIPKGADPTKVCPCGEKAFLGARLFPEQVVEEFRKATNGKEPKVIERWKKAALLATISCERHVRIPMAEEVEAAGLAGDTFDKRLAGDLPNSIFAVDVSMHEDKNKKRALLAYGPLVASVVINDHLLSALHMACGKPLRGEDVEAVVTTPNVLCLHEPGFDDDQLDQVLDMGAAADGIPQNVDPPFDLSWDVSLKAAPVGRFVNLHPPPPGQQQPPPGPGGPGQTQTRR